MAKDIWRKTQQQKRKTRFLLKTSRVIYRLIIKTNCKILMSQIASKSVLLFESNHWKSRQNIIRPSPWKYAFKNLMIWLEFINDKKNKSILFLSVRRHFSIDWFCSWDNILKSIKEIIVLYWPSINHLSGLMNTSKSSFSINFKCLHFLNWKIDFCAT